MDGPSGSGHTSNSSSSREYLDRKQEGRVADPQRHHGTGGAPPNHRNRYMDVNGHEDSQVDVRASGSYNHDLLQLRSAINEKELELVELREQHIRLVHRSSQARANWEDAIQSKDRAIEQLQEALRAKERAIERLDRASNDAMQRMLEQQRQQQEKELESELEEKERELAAMAKTAEKRMRRIADLEDRLAEREARLREEIGQRTRVVGSVEEKAEQLQKRVQDLEAALRAKEKVGEGQARQHAELKALVWEREGEISELQLSQQQLESTVAKKSADIVGLEAERERLKLEKAQADEEVARLKEEIKAQHKASIKATQAKALMAQEIQSRVGELQSQMADLQEGVASKEARLQRQKTQMRELQSAVRVKETALSDALAKNQQLREEHNKLVEEHARVLRERENARQEAERLQAKVTDFEQELLATQRAVADADQTHRLEAQAAELRRTRRNAEELAADLARERAARAGEVQREVQKVEKRHRQQLREVKTVAEGRIAELEAALHREKMACTEASAELQRMVAEERERTNLEERHEALQEEGLRKEATWRQLEAKLRAELDHRTAQLSEAEKFQAELERVVRRLAARVGS